MDDKSNLVNKDISNKQIEEDKIRPIKFKIDVRKVFSKKLKAKLNISNNSQPLKLVKRSTDSKNSQTIIKNYDYEFNKVIKPKTIIDSINSFHNFNIHSTKNVLSYKVKAIRNNIKETNKTKKFFFKRSKSLKSNYLYNSLYLKEKEIRPLNITKYKPIKLGKKPKSLKKNLSQNIYRRNKNLEKIGVDFLNFSNVKNTNKSNIINKIDDNKKKESKKDKIEQENNRNNDKKNNFNNHSTPDITLKNTFIQIDAPRELNRKPLVRNNIFFLKNRNEIYYRNNWRYPKEEINTTNWKNNIINKLISDIKTNIEEQNKNTKNPDLSEDNPRCYHKIRISTLMNLYNKNFSNYKYKQV